ncbi:uncharacterized protein LOC144660905 [Oculina patagonica]
MDLELGLLQLFSHLMFFLMIISCFPEAFEALSRSSEEAMVYTNFDAHKWSYLNITSIGVDLVQDDSECGFACLEIASCFSYNLAAFPDNNGKLPCELLPSDKYNNSDKFISSPVYHHYSITSPCSSTPCKNKGTCVSQYKNNSYVCVCTKEYTGRNCQTKILLSSTIITGNEFYEKHFHQFLAPVVGNRVQWKLCFRASSHGWAAKTFHSLCDGKNHTVTIIKKGQYVFGGYTDIPWDTSNSSHYGFTAKAFIFSLRNKEGLGPFKSMVARPEYAIYRGTGPNFSNCYCPTFGKGHDIHIVDNANTLPESYTDFGQFNVYSVPSGVQDPFTVLAGTNKFSPDDWEVFYLG